MKTSTPRTRQRSRKVDARSLSREDRDDLRIAERRIADIAAGRTKVLSLEEAFGRSGMHPDRSMKELSDRVARTAGKTDRKPPASSTARQKARLPRRTGADPDALSPALKARLKRMLSVDLDVEAARLLKKLKAAMPELEAQDIRNAQWVVDGIYRFYHRSWDVYGLQRLTIETVKLLRAMAPESDWPLDALFEEIVAAGTGQHWQRSHNRAWGMHTRPIVEAFLHARYFLEMAVDYGRKLKRLPTTLPSGWAALLTLYGLR